MMLMRKDSLKEAASCDEKRHPATLSDEKLSLDLHSEFSKMQKFYSLELSIARDGSALQKVTIEKMIKRFYRYLWFLKYIKNITPVKLFLCANLDFVEELFCSLHDR